MITQRELNEAVARVLRAKFVAGLFDGKCDPLPVTQLARHIHTPEHIALARRVAEESVILLKNDAFRLAKS